MHAFFKREMRRFENKSKVKSQIQKVNTKHQKENETFLVSNFSNSNHLPL